VPDDRALSRADLASFRDARELAIARLSDAFAKGDLEIEEFERRLTLAHRAESPAALATLLEDLDEAAAGAPPESVSTALTVVVPQAATVSTARDEQWAVSILGSTVRRGAWTPARTQRVLAVMGNVELDYRDASFASGVSEVVVSTIMGSIEITVPPTLAVEMTGTAILGSFEHTERAPLTPDPDRPVLRIHGLSVLGSVTIRTRLPGESGFDAFLRRRRERKALRASAKAGLLPGGGK
jgi:hypothetical protein